MVPERSRPNTHAERGLGDEAVVHEDTDRAGEQLVLARILRARPDEHRRVDAPSEPDFVLGVAETAAEDARSILALQMGSSCSLSTRALYIRAQRTVATSLSDPRVIDALGSDTYAGAVLEGRVDVGGGKGREDTKQPA